MGRDERIMVVPREFVTPYRMYGSHKIDQATLYQSIYAPAIPRMRSEVEEDERYLQVVPYVVIYEGATVLGAHRLHGGTERRLHDRYLAGFGGHVKWDDDADPEQMVQRTVRHELHEELGYGLNLKVPPFSHVLFDDTNPVGRVHVGLLTWVKMSSLAPGVNLVSAEPEKLELFLLNESFYTDHKDRLEGWALLALRVFWSSQIDEGIR